VGFDELGEAGSAMGYVMFRGTLAEALGRAGQIADGIAAIEEALAWTEHTRPNARATPKVRLQFSEVITKGAALRPVSGRTRDHVPPLGICNAGLAGRELQ
jgi:hypothetical protein